MRFHRHIFWGGLLLYCSIARAASAQASDDIEEVSRLRRRLETYDSELLAAYEPAQHQDVIRTLPTLPVSTSSSAAESLNAELASNTAAAADKPAAPAVKSLTPFVGDCGNITFTPGLRVQPRYVYDAANGNNDFLIQRFRLKGSGDAFALAKYGVELKIDNVGRFEKDPKAEMENAWIDFPVNPDLGLRVGLYDIPFSRDALTSDSKLLLMDRSLIKDALTAIGMADNTIGVMAHGRPFEGHFEYAVGIFDNLAFEKIGATGTRESDQLMPAGRIAIDLLDPAKPGGYADYQGSYIGKGQRLSIGADSAYLGDAHDGASEFNLVAWGTDIFFNTGPFTFQAEIDWFQKDMISATPNVDGSGWYVQAGYLITSRAELAARYQELDPSDSVPNDRLRWTSVGLNYYIREHNLKIQTDYTFKDEEGPSIDNDVYQLQLQLDF